MIKFNGVEWQIYLVSPFHSGLKSNDNTYALGCCDNNTRIIYIANDVKKDYLKKVLCHELTHAAMFSYNIKLTYDQEELVADIIATYGLEIIHMTNEFFIRLKEEKGEYLN